MRVMLAMSGGVDSSVAGALLLEEGHEVVGVTMRLWGGESDSGCCSVSDVDDARRVAQQLGIDHVVFNFSDDFDRTVVAPYVDAHRRGVTPNPCIECNRHIKFDRLLERAEVLGFDAVATGHHALIERPVGAAPRLRRGADPAKDQSYVVHMLSAAQLDRVLFPVGTWLKDDLRARGIELGLRTATKPDRQDVCFITSTGGRSTFLGERIPFRSATVVDTAGETLGEIDAVELVTIGQRRGLGLPGGGPKRYVLDVVTVHDHDASTAGSTAGSMAKSTDRVRVVVGDEQDLLVDGLVASQPVWIDGTPQVGDEVLVQCGAHGRPRPARVTGVDDDSFRLAWQQPETLIAPGQSVVLYDTSDRYVLGGGLARPASAQAVQAVQITTGSRR